MNKIGVKEILDSNSRPTIEVQLKTNKGIFKASVPSGVSTGAYEAAELRDKDGGVKKVLENIGKIIAPVLEKENSFLVDDILIQLDDSKNKSRLGANAILAVSMAYCRAQAANENLPLYRYIGKLAAIEEIQLPKPSFNMVEGGEHAKSGLAFQEFMIICQKKTFKENFEAGKKIYQNLKKRLEKKYGKKNVELSKEGAFSPPVKKVFETLDLILEAADKSEIKIAIDSASSQIRKDGIYAVDGQFYSSKELADFYSSLVKKYPIISLEDPFAQDDYAAWASFMQKTKHKMLIIGDDLTATNLDRIKMAREKKLCNGIIIKPNQIGTVSETLEAVKLAKSFGWKIMVANRAGETKDDFIADLAVGIGADYIKSGAPFPKERMVKYERLKEIEKEMAI